MASHETGDTTMYITGDIMRIFKCKKRRCIKLSTAVRSQRSKLERAFIFLKTG